MKAHRAVAALLPIAVSALGCVAAPQVDKAEVTVKATQQSFDPELIRRGAGLAQIGNCMSCHTAPRGEAFAGGVPLHVPFGTIYSSNITPDPDTGIGNWSEAEFRRAMHDGIGRDGRHLYPAFPYDHFALVTDDDVKAIYAFLMTRDPVHAESPANQLGFPFNVRDVVAGWNLLFLHEAPFKPDPSKSAEWNRGAYLAEGLGHCGACHTPRNLFAAEKQERTYAGGEAEGWIAPALGAGSPAPRPWDADELYNYLRHGRDIHHGTAAGPMQLVTHDLSQAAEADVRAIATYFAAAWDGVSGKRPEVPSGMPEQHQAATKAIPDGAAIFAGACAGCHGSDAPLAGWIPLASSTALNLDSPRNAVQIILHGVQPMEGEHGAYMPGFATMLRDQQMADLLAYLRVRFSGKSPWQDTGSQVREIRSEGY